MGWGSGTANFPYLVDPLSAIAKWVRSQDPTVVVDFLLEDFNLKQAGILAARSELCMVFTNADSGEGYIAHGEVKGDRNDLFAEKNGDALVINVAERCGSGIGDTIVIVHSVGPIVVEKWINARGVKGLIFANLPGEESGNSLVCLVYLIR